MANVNVKTVGGKKFQLSITAGQHTFTCDQPKSVGGDDGGPGPKELALAGLGACVAQTIMMVAPKRKWDIKSLSVKVSISYPKGSNGDPKIEEEIEVQGNLTASELDAIKRVASRCPVYKLFMENKTIETVVVHK